MKTKYSGMTLAWLVSICLLTACLGGAGSGSTTTNSPTTNTPSVAPTTVAPTTTASTFSGSLSFGSSICQDYTGSAWSASSISNSTNTSTYSASHCASTNAVGKCASGGGNNIDTYYYSPYYHTSQSVTCASSGGTWTALINNIGPVANAGATQNINVGSLVSLSGAGSYDANSDPLSYNWTLTSKPASSTATLTGSTTSAPSFTADLVGAYVATLTVNDGLVNSPNSSVTITAGIPPGSLDVTFNATGKAITTFAAGSAIANGAALQSDGKIVVAGTVTNGTVSSFALARYNTDGSLDTAFGTAGMVTSAIGIGNSYGNAVVIQQDGKIVVAGEAQKSASYVLLGVTMPAMYGYALARYNVDGTLDTTFNTTGTLVQGIGYARSGARAVALQSDGKIVVAGYYDVLPTGRWGSMARFNIDGSFDSTYAGGNGKLGYFDFANAVAIQADGKIVIAGNAGQYFVVNRFTQGGILDSGFGIGGLVGNWGFGPANALAIQSDGKILAVGNNATQGFTFARYNPINGSVDNAFGYPTPSYSWSTVGGGYRSIIVGTGNDIAKAVAVQADGKIVAVGTTYNGLFSDFALVRISADSVTNDINVVTPVGTTHTATANAMVIQSDGKIIAVGGTGGATSSFALVRYLP